MTQDLARDVELAVLRRRVESMEVLVLGGIRRGPEPEQVMSLFVEATKLQGVRGLPADAVRGWSHAILCLSEEHLLELARRLGDPAPWRVFLRLIVGLRENGHAEEVAAADVHLGQIIRNLLDAAGLQLLQPDDMLLSELPLEQRVTGG